MEFLFNSVCRYKFLANGSREFVALGNTLFKIFGEGEIPTLKSDITQLRRLFSVGDNPKRLDTMEQVKQAAARGCSLIRLSI